MSIQHNPAQIGILQYLADRRNIAALGQPNARPDHGRNILDIHRAR